MDILNIQSWGGKPLTTCCWSGVLLLGVLACKPDDDVCTLEPQRGIELTVVDAVNANDLGALAVVTVTRLSPRAPASSGPPEQVPSLTATPGVYELRIVAAGYMGRTDTVSVASRRIGGCERTVTVARTVQLSPQR